MQNLTQRQIQRIHGAGSIETAVLRFYLYSLTDPGIAFPTPGGTLF